MGCRLDALMDDVYCCRMMLDHRFLNFFYMILFSVINTFCRSNAARILLFWYLCFLVHRQFSDDFFRNICSCIMDLLSHL